MKKNGQMQLQTTNAIANRPLSKWNEPYYFLTAVVIYPYVLASQFSIKQTSGIQWESHFKKVCSVILG